MKPNGWLHTSVVEVGIQALMKDLPTSSKKIVMPLRIAQMIWDPAEVKELFSYKNRLDKKDMVMLPVIQPLNPKSKEKIHHYFVVNLNIGDMRFEVMDSWRTLNDKVLKSCVHKIIASVRIHFDDNYPRKKINLDPWPLEEINVPRQLTNHECGVCTLTNCQLWGGRLPPKYAAKDLPNIRKLLTYGWVTSLHNKIKWEETLGQK
ncbi:hypothetical protein ACQ4PT_002713 [Festuca glaucescens]